jgi:hypothetical protein
VLEGGLQHIAAAVDVGGVDVLRRVKRQRRRRVDDNVDPCHRLIDHAFVADVALDLGDLAALRVGEVGNVERRPCDRAPADGAPG